MKLEQGTSGLGNISYVLGLVFAIIAFKLFAPLAGNLIDKISMNSVTKTEVNSYINDSIEIKVLFQTYNFSISYFGNFLNGKSARQSTKTMDYNFFDIIHKRYFVLKTPDDYNTKGLVFELLKNKDVVVNANATQYHNNSYGSISKPIPIFSLKYFTNDTSWSDEEKKDVKAEIDDCNEKYKQTVSIYLTYFISKKDFKKMFGK